MDPNPNQPRITLLRSPPPSPPNTYTFSYNDVQIPVTVAEHPQTPYVTAWVTSVRRHNRRAPTLTISVRAYPSPSRPTVVSLFSPGAPCLLLELGPTPRALAELLGERRVRMVGVGVGEVRAREKVELRGLVEKAFGKVRGKMEEMARVVLGVEVERRKGKEGFGEEEGWLRVASHEDVMFAVRDAFLACEIAEKCFRVIEEKEVSGV